MRMKRDCMSFARLSKVSIRSIIKSMLRSMRGKRSGFMKDFKMANVDR